MTTASQIHMNDEAVHADRTTMFGFWVYLMTDFILFASLFSVFIVLRGSAAHAFEMPVVLAETLILLTSSLTCGLALIAARAGHLPAVLVWMYVTALLGVAFVGIELSEFRSLIEAGHSPASSGFFSAFFTLVGTHGLHVTAGIVWMISLAVALMRHGLTRGTMRKLMLLGMFWHFLDIIWIFIFSIVYLIGAV